MRLTFTLLGLAMLCSIFCKAQEALPYYYDFEEDDTDWVQYRLGPTTDDFYTWEFVNDELAHYYPVGGDEITDDWMVSPSFDFSNGATIDSVKHKFGGFGIPFGLDTVALYLVNGAQNPANATEITLIHLYTDENYEPDNVWKTLYDVTIPPISGESYIAFRYKTDYNWLDVFFDDMNISGSTLSTRDIQKTEALKLYPNPTAETLQLETGGNKIQILSVYDMTGALVKQENNLFELEQIDITDLPTGVFSIKAEYDDGTQAIGKVVINR